MQFKTLRHKLHPDIYGHPGIMPLEILQKPIPLLYPITTTMEFMKGFYLESLVSDQLDEYELIEVTIIPAITGLAVAKELFNIHHHMVIDEYNMNTVIVYKEDELLPLLRQWGIPNPDWEGNANV